MSDLERVYEQMLNQQRNFQRPHPSLLFNAPPTLGWQMLNRQNRPKIHPALIRAKLEGLPPMAYFGPKCSKCGSRRTERIDDTNWRLCHGCGATGRLVVNSSGPAVQIIEDGEIAVPRGSQEPSEATL